MPLSTDTLIHFTKKKSTLKKILEGKFCIYNCKETLIFNGKPSDYHIPMVCFCDIPLSEVKAHMSTYGVYGIGMTKEWGRKMGLNPVLYMEQKSALSVNIQLAVNHFTRQPNKPTRDPDSFKAEQKALVDLLRYIKNYQADLIREGKKTILDYRFSDEREWRYVPPHSKEYDLFFHDKHCADGNTKAASDTKLVDLRLEFEPNDIKYIIIKNDSEIEGLIKHLYKTYENKYSTHDIARLTTRILTSEQIKNDM